MGDATCSVPGCTDLYLAKGLCNKHYQRQKKLGSFEDHPSRACTHCGEDFQPRRSDQLYCSDLCKVRARPLKPKTVKPDVECRFCHTVFQYRRGQDVCESEACQRAYHNEAVEKSRAKTRAARLPKLCAGCGNLFEVTTHNKAYCSVACRRKSHLQHRRDTEYRPEPKICVHCKQPVPYKSGRKRFCSDQCAVVYANKNARWTVKGLAVDLEIPLVCALCGKSTKKLDIDHDHACCPGERACGKCFRGFLCRSCNVGLGLFGDDPERLLAAAEYIERHRVALKEKSHD